jgi:electron transfer flavoprotein alpha subunit
MSATYVLVAGHSGVAELVKAAVGLGQPVIAIVAGSAELASQLATDGVDKVIWFGEPGDKPLEAFAAEAGRIVAAEPGVVFGGRRPAERVLLGAVAAAISAPVITGATKITQDAGQTVVTQEVYGGVALATTAFNGPVALLLDGGAAVTGGGAAPVETAATTPLPITVTELRPNVVSEADLASAARVVSVGRGLKAKEDLGLIEALAQALDAEVSCSRPLAEGLEWLGRDRYVGISGQRVTPDLYLAVGVSGQLQHLGGMRGSGMVVSINTDAEAPIRAESDFILTGDLYRLVPAITAALG